MATTSSVTELPEIPKITTDQLNPVDTRPGETSVAENPAPITAVASKVNKPTDTVSGQITSLLDQNSDYMKSDKTSALQGMNSKGLIHSNMAIGASQKAAIDSAMTIATQDAATYNNTRLTNQAADNRFKENEQAFGMNKSVNEQNQRLTLDRMDVEDTYKRSGVLLESELKAYNDQFSAALTADLESIKSDMALSATMKINYANNVSSLVNNYTSVYSAIMTSERTPAQQTTALKNLDKQFKANSDYLKTMTYSSTTWDW